LIGRDSLSNWRLSYLPYGYFLHNMYTDVAQGGTIIEQMEPYVRLDYCLGEPIDVAFIEK
jgi:hypothetical protein